MTDKLDLQSPDLVNENIEEIAALFPNCITEGENGRTIDFDQLRQELNHDIVEGTKERYRLEWPGKREAIVTANLPTTNTRRPHPNKVWTLKILCQRHRKRKCETTAETIKSRNRNEGDIVLCDK